MKEFLIITGVVVFGFLLIFFIIKEIIRTFRNRPYDDNEKDRL